MPRRGGFPVRSGGAVHNKEWTAACIDSTPVDLAIGTLVVFSVFVADEAETLLRSRGSIQLVLNANAVEESVTCAVGLAIVSARAVAAGAASVPRPATEGSYPWLWHGFLFGTSFDSAVTAGSSLRGTRLEVNSKAMRKLKETEVMVLAFEVCESVDLGGSFQLDAGLRVLTGD